jgi:glycosyltransferase involved in cell wall biosynthesis
VRQDRVVLLIRSLDIGGAERQLVQLAIGLHRRGLPVLVITFYDGGALSPELERAGVPRWSLGKRGRWDVFGFLLRLAAALRRARPTVVYGFLVTANTLLALLKPLLRGAVVVWGVRASAVDLAKYDFAARLSYRLERALSWLPDLIIANAEAGRRHAIAAGFPAARVVVVPNGIDTQRFCRDEEGRRRVRTEWGIGEEESLVGVVARLDPMKDQATFLRAAQRVAAEMVGVKFVCVGDGPAAYWQEMLQLAAALGIGERVVWTGGRGDMPAVFSALDIACSASVGEGFSNAMAEAMACGVPCVATDVGDTALLIGEAGRIVPPGDPAAMAAAILDLLRADPQADAGLRARARDRIVENFGSDALADRTLAAWAATAGARRRMGSVVGS